VSTVKGDDAGITGVEVHPDLFVGQLTVGKRTYKSEVDVAVDWEGETFAIGGMQYYVDGLI
jgi:hypothetical protein